MIETGGKLYSLQPKPGLLPGAFYPFGKLGSRLTLGYGGTAFIDPRMPMAAAMVKVRMGPSVGFMYYPAQSTVTPNCISCWSMHT